MGLYGVGGKRIPYIVHPERVAAAMAKLFPDNLVYQIVAWLHDVLEDTSVTREKLIELGIGEESVVMVENLSRDPEDSYFDFIMKFRYLHMSRQVKIGDITDNMEDNLKEGSMKDKYRLARYALEGFNKEDARKKAKRKPKESS